MTSKPVTPLPPNRQRGNGTTRSPLAAGEQRGTEGSGCFPHALPDAGTDGSAFPPARLPREANGPNGSAPEHGTPVRPAAALRERPRREGSGGGPGPPPAAAGPLPAPRAAPGAARLPRPGPAPQPPPTHQPRRAAPTAFPAAEGRLLRAAAPAPGSGTSQRDGTHQRPDGAPSSSFPFFARPRSAAPDPPASGSHRPPRGCERPRSGALTGPDRRCCAGARSAGGAAARPLYRPPPPRPRAQGRWRCVTSPGRRAEGRLTAAPGADAVPPGVRLPPPPPPGREGRVRL